MLLLKTPPDMVKPFAEYTLDTLQMNGIGRWSKCTSPIDCLCASRPVPLTIHNFIIVTLHGWFRAACSGGRLNDDVANSVCLPGFVCLTSGACAGYGMGQRLFHSLWPSDFSTLQPAHEMQAAEHRWTQDGGFAAP